MKPRTRAKPRTDARPAAAPLDWAQCNFLENLLRCVLDTRSVPRESGVHFQISSRVKDDAICLLFHVDRGDDGVIKKGPRPDYLVAHLGPAGLILTIVELKGSELRNLEHGVEQICAFYERLRDEVKTHLPSWLKIHYQGVLLCAQGAQTPNKMIADEKRLVIVPLRYHHKADLYPYVRKRLARTDTYRHDGLPFDPSHQFSRLDGILARGPLRSRVEDDLYRERFRAKKPRLGIYLNFSAGPGDAAYLTLVGDPERRDIVLGAPEPRVRALVENELQQLRLRPDGKRFWLHPRGA